MTRRDPITRLALVLFPLALVLGSCSPLWDAMPWAVTP